MCCNHNILSRDWEILTIGYPLVLIADAWFDSLFQQCKDSIQHNCYLQSRIDGIQTSSSKSKKVVLFLWNIMFSWLEELTKEVIIKYRQKTTNEVSVSLCALPRYQLHQAYLWVLWQANTDLAYLDHHKTLSTACNINKVTYALAYSFGS